jgi:alcohol dehydrogenase class IV
MIENRDVLLTDAKEKSVALLQFIRNIIFEAKFNVSLREYGLGEYNISDMAEKGLTLKTALNNNPVNFSNDDAISILKRLI